MSVVDIKVDAKLDLWLKNLKTSWQASVASRWRDISLYKHRLVEGEVLVAA